MKPASVAAMEKGTTPQSLIAYAPYGAGLMCALFYVSRGVDVYGWWIGKCGSDYRSAYFKLENFFTTKPMRFYATDGMDLYGGLRFHYSARQPVLDKPVPMDDDVCHELDRLQNVFVAEWLVFEDGADIGAERDEYKRLGLPLGHVAVRSKRLGKLDESDSVWSYRSHDFDLHILERLERYWPLDYRPSREGLLPAGRR
jgi:hypothetical protein